MCNAETQTDETDFYLMYQVSSVIPQRKTNTARLLIMIPHFHDIFVADTQISFMLMWQLVLIHG